MGVDVLILAAGAGRRFGSNKLLALWRGRPLLEHVLEKVALLDVDSINLVLGAYATEIEELLREKSHIDNLPSPLPKCFIYSDWQLGMGDSLAFGVSQLPSENAVLVLLADQPLIELGDLQKLLVLGRKNPDKIVCAEFAGTRGAPALFPPEYKTRLRLLSGDRGAKILLSFPDVITVDLFNAAIDIDSPSDLTLLPCQ